MKIEKDSTCQVLILAPTKEQGIAVVGTWKKTEEECEGQVKHSVYVCGDKDNKLEGELEEKNCMLVCLTAESQEDWDKVKKEWVDKFQDKLKKVRKLVAANKEEKSKKWFTDIKADNYVDLSKAEDTFKTLRKELSDYCKLKCKTTF